MLDIAITWIFLRIFRSLRRDIVKYSGNKVQTRNYKARPDRLHRYLKINNVYNYYSKCIHLYFRNKTVYNFFSILYVGQESNKNLSTDKICPISGFATHSCGSYS